MNAPARRVQPWVKICGITHPADALEAIRLGAAALGFNFYPGSKRRVSIEADAGWIAELPSCVQKIAVVVNARRAEIDRLMEGGLVDAIQLHGDEDAEFCRALQTAGIPFIKAIRVRDAASLENVERFQARDVVLDAFQPGEYGGTGRRVDWSLAAAFAARRPAGIARIILSGGLAPEHVADPIRPVRPGGVDVASGVEGAIGPRRKDAQKMRAFFEAVSSAE